MSELPSFSLSDIADVDADPEDFVRPVREAEDAAERVRRVHCVRWDRHQGIVVMKEVHLWEEDTVTTDVRTIAARIQQLQCSTRGTAAAAYFVSYLALHIDTPRHYQWLLSRCGPSLKTLLDRSRINNTQPCFSESCCRQILRCVLMALQHLHTVCAFVHGDISLNNILTHRSFREQNRVLLGDLETLNPIGGEPSGSPGTLLYTSPERLHESSLPYSAQDDVWAFGVVAYQLLTSSSRTHPWCDDAPVASRSPDNFWAFLDAMNARRGVSPLLYLRETSLASCCPAAMSMVAMCLSWEPSDRPTASALLKHSWFSV